MWLESKSNNIYIYILRFFKRFQKTNPNSRKFERDRESIVQKMYR